MALAESQEVALSISAETSGQSDVSALVQQIEALAREGGEAGPRFAELAEQLKKVGQQQQLVTSFAELKRETRGYATELQKAQAATSAAMSVLREKRVAVDAATKSERDAAVALASAARAQERLKAEVAAARDALRSLTARSKESGTETAAFANQIEAARARLADLRTASAEAGKTVGVLKQAYDPVAQAMREAGKASREAESAFKKNVAEAQRLKPAYEKSRETLHRLRQEMQEAGINSRFLGAEEKRLVAEMAAATAAANAQVSAVAMLVQAGKERVAAARQQAQEEDRLAAIVAASKAKLAQAAQEQLAAEKRAYAESQEAARRYAEVTRTLATATQRAFDTIGIRSSATIQSEIAGIQQGLQRLAADATVTGADFDRAWAKGQQRIAALKAEAAGGIDPLTHSVSRATQAGGMLNTKMKEVATTVGGLFAVSRLPAIAADLGRTADLYANLKGRIDLVNASQDGFNITLDQTAELARNTHTNLESTTSLLAALARAGEEVGLSQEGTLRLTETINKANQVAGQSAASADAAIVQLIQGLQSGVLRGEEFNSVMEQSPRLARALADGLGVSLGALREMSKQGELTSAVVIEALQSQAQAIDEEFGKLPLTIGRAMTDLGTNWTQFLGELDQTHGVSTRVAEALQGVANNLDTIARLAAVAGEVALAAFAAKLIPQVAKFGAEAIAATQKVGGLRAGIAALPTTVKIGLAVVGFEMLQEAGKLIGETAAKWSGAGEQMRQAEERMRESNRAMLASGQELANSSERYRNIVTLTAEEVARLSETEQAAYLDRLNGAKDYFTGAQRAAQASKELGIASEFSADQAAAGLQRAREALADFEAGARMSREEIENLLSIDATLLIEQFDAVKAKGKDTADALKEIGKGFDATAVDSIRGFGQALTELQINGRISADEVGLAWQTALAKLDGSQLNAFTAAAQAAFGQSARDIDALAAAMDGALRASIAATGQDFEQLQTGISTNATAALGHLDLLASGFDGLKARGLDASKALVGAVDFAADAADSTKALAQLRSEVQQLGTQGKLSADQVTSALGKIDDKVDQLTPGVNSLAEALKNLGIQSDEDMHKVADGFREAYQVVREMGGSVREQREAFEKYAEAAIRANGGVADAALQAQAKQHGLRIEADAAGRAIVSAMQSGAQSTAALGAEAAQTAAEVREIGNAAADAADALDGMNKAGAAGSQGKSYNKVSFMGVEQMLDRAESLGGLKFRKELEAEIDARSRVSAGSINGWNRYGDIINDISKRLDALQIEKEADSGKYETNRPRITGSSQRENTTVHRVEIGIGAGRKVGINTADRNSADALVELLRQLEADMARA